MISSAVIEEAMLGALHRAATQLPPDVDDLLRRALAGEEEELARRHLEVSLENTRLAAHGEGLVCGDTGFPLFFVRAGGKTCVEGGYGSLWSAARAATARATAAAWLRPTMVDPLRRTNPGTNVGPGMPRVQLRFDGAGAGLQVLAAPKGGGSEIFGTYYRMLFPSDGEAGIKHFVLECIRDACYAGKVCPPAILGVGIGGTADACMTMAKEAALLRPLGSHHPDPSVARLEKELFAAARQLGVGPMGARGSHALLALHMETALTHTAALPVAVNAQCLIGRRWCASIAPGGAVTYAPCSEDWMAREEEVRHEG